MSFNVLDCILFILTFGKLCKLSFESCKLKESRQQQKTIAVATTDGYGPIPMSYFWRIYLYSYFLSWNALFYMIAVYFTNNVKVSKIVRLVFLLIMHNQKPVSVLAALSAMVMICVQCTRRLYDALFIQIYAKNTQINGIHFLLAVVHYTICVLAIIGASPLFCGPLDPKRIRWYDSKSLSALIPCSLLFTWASYEQHQSNAILQKQRNEPEKWKNKRRPKERLFAYVASPHRLTEVLIYAAVGLLMQTTTYYVIILWVLSSQLEASWEAQKISNLNENTIIQSEN